jgi:isoamylase
MAKLIIKLINSVAEVVSHSFPLGATLQPDGVNFSLFSKNSAGLDLVLFDDADAGAPSQVIALYPKESRISHYWRR